MSDKEETRVWMRAYSMAMKLYPYDDTAKGKKISESIRHCRIFAMAYSQGFMNGRRAARRCSRKV